MEGIEHKQMQNLYDIQIALNMSITWDIFEFSEQIGEHQLHFDDLSESPVGRWSGGFEASLKGGVYVDGHEGDSFDPDRSLSTASLGATWQGISTGADNTVSWVRFKES